MNKEDILAAMKAHAESVPDIPTDQFLAASFRWTKPACRTGSR